MCTARG